MNRMTISKAESMNYTTRRYPRTYKEAFPHEARYERAFKNFACSGEQIAGIFLAILIGSGLAAALVFWWTTAAA